MNTNRQNVLFCFFFIIVGIFLVSSISALENYDERVYKISSSYSINNEYTPKNHYSQDYSAQNYYERRDNPPYDRRNNNYYERIAPPYTDKPRYTFYAFEDTRKSFWGDYVKEYSVYITNRERTGRYFTVTFELENKYRDKFTQSVTRYLRTGEKEKFVYRDIQYERNEILDWDYTILPLKY